MSAEHQVGADAEVKEMGAEVIARIPEAQIEPPQAEKPDSTWQDVTLDDIYAARERIASYIHRTPIMDSKTLNRLTNVNLGMKAEIFQKTGSFKSRGALNAVMQLSEEQKARGIITLSAGNHGQGIAFAAQLVGTRAVVFMPETAVPTKVEAIRNYGAEARFAPNMEGIYPIMEAYQREHGLTYISPYDHPHIIAGQGTIGLEILEDMPDVDTVVVAVGGGGLIAGISLAIKSLRPDVRVVGVEPEGANVVKRSMESGKIEQATEIHTIADGLAAPFAGQISQPIIDRCVDDIVLVNDDEIKAALRMLLSRSKIMVEGAGAASIAGLMTGKVGAAHGSNVVAVLSGGNIDPEKLKSII